MRIPVAAFVVAAVHLNPVYTQTLVKFIDGHDR